MCVGWGGGEKMLFEQALQVRESILAESRSKQWVEIKVPFEF